MDNVFSGPVNDLIIDGAIAAIDDGRTKGLKDHDTREYYLRTCAAAFDENAADRSDRQDAAQ